MKSKIATAYHEAGHCVAACLVRKRFKIVTIIPEKEALGKCITIPWRDFHPDYKTDHQTILKGKKAIFILLAGPITECIYTQTKKPSGSKELQEVYDVADNLCSGSYETADAYVNFMWEQTKDIISLDYNWKAVEVVANALLKRETLRYREVRCLIKEAQEGVIHHVDLL